MNNYLSKVEYVYKGVVKRVIDGDTVIIDIIKTVDMGFGIIHTQTKKNEVFRLHKVYALEKTKRFGQSDDEKKLGIKAKKIVEELLPVGEKIVVYTHKNRKEKYGRYLAHIYTEALGEVSINDFLLAKKSPMFLTYDQHLHMMENRRKKKNINLK